MNSRVPVPVDPLETEDYKPSDRVYLRQLIVPLRDLNLPNEFSWLLDDPANTSLNSLTLPQWRFVQEYCVDFNAGEAYGKVFKSRNPGKAARRFLKQPKIQAAIVRHLTLYGESLTIKKDTLIGLLWSMAINPDAKDEVKLRAIEDIAKLTGMDKGSDDDEPGKRAPSVHVHIADAQNVVFGQKPFNQQPEPEVNIVDVTPENQHQSSPPTVPRIPDSSE